MRGAPRITVPGLLLAAVAWAAPDRAAARPLPVVEQGRAAATIVRPIDRTGGREKRPGSCPGCSER